eukprot:11203025-Lingulodinium_polyedra.AAC.1
MEPDAPVTLGASSWGHFSEFAVAPRRMMETPFDVEGFVRFADSDSSKLPEVWLADSDSSKLPEGLARGQAPGPP